MARRSTTLRKSPLLGSAPVAARILFLIDSLDRGGAEQALVETVAHLDRQAFVCEVAYLWEPSPLTDRLETLGIPVHRVRARRGDWSMLSLLRIRRLLKAGHFDVIHTMQVWSSIVGRLAGRWAKVKVVSDIGGLDPDGWVEQVLPPKEARRVKATAQLDSLTARLFVDRFIATSSGGALGASSRKVSIVPRGLNLSDLRARASEPVDPPLPPLEGPVVLTVGDLTPPKDQRSLIDAMATVHAAFPTATLLVVGEGSLHRMLEARAQPLGSDVVRFLGRREDVPALLAMADLFVIPAVWEPTGSALVEAMAIGRPIVATRIPTFMDTVRDGSTAVLARAGDPLSLGDAIVRVLRDPISAAAMGDRAKDESAEHDVVHTVTLLEDVYRSVLRRRRPPPR